MSSSHHLHAVHTGPMDADEARACVNAIRGHWTETRRLIVDLHDREGWRALGYVSWPACMKAEFGIQKWAAHAKLRAARIEAECEISHFSLRDFHLAALGELSGDERESVIDELAGDLSKDGQRRTLARLQERVTQQREKRELYPLPSPTAADDSAVSLWPTGAPIPWPDGACRLLLTSPPFAMNKPYADGGDVANYAEYRELMATWAGELLRVASPRDGRLCLHVPLDRALGGIEPVYADWLHALKLAGWTYRATILAGAPTMNKSQARGSTAAPNVVAPVETVIVCYRGAWRQDGPRDLDHDDWVRWAGPGGIWSDLAGEDDARHPAVFDRRLVYRLLRLYSGPGDTVADPFCGRGTVPVLTSLLGRNPLACDRSATYVELARHNLDRAELAGSPVDLAELHRSAMNTPDSNGLEDHEERCYLAGYNEEGSPDSDGNT